MCYFSTSMEISNPEKNIQIINYFARKENGKIDYLKLMKLVYFSDKYMLFRYGRTLSNNRYMAFQNGPAPSEIKDIAKGIVYDEIDERIFPASKKYSQKYLKQASSSPKEYNIESIKEVDEDLFSRAETEAMDAVYEKFGDKRNFTLCKITHFFPEWEKHGVDGKSKFAAPMKLRDFFSLSGNPELDDFFNPNPEDAELKKQYFQLQVAEG